VSCLETSEQRTIARQRGGRTKRWVYSRPKWVSKPSPLDKRHSSTVNHFACPQKASKLFSASRTGNPGGPTCQRRFRRTATSGRRPASCSSPPVDSPAAPGCTAPWQARSPAYSCVPTPRSCSRGRGRSSAPLRRASSSSSTPERPPRRRPPCCAFIISRASDLVRRVSNSALSFRPLGCTSAARRNAPYHFFWIAFLPARSHFGVARASLRGAAADSEPEQRLRESELIFLGTGTSEGIPRVSCITHPTKTCPV
jgi:hypothetical protein